MADTALSPEAPPRRPFVLRASGVSHRYGKKTALHDVALELHEGETLALIGPDGAGKSTLLGLLAGTRRVMDGHIEVLNGPIRDAGHRARIAPRIAFMPQGLGRNLYPSLSVEENILFFAQLFGLEARGRPARIDELLSATGLAPFRSRAAGKLSGGMKQKLGLCCALIHDPDLLILDEPTTGVDPLSRRQFWALVDRLRARRPRMAVLVATAYMDEAARFDTLIALHEGRVLDRGRPAQLMQRTGADSLERAYAALLPGRDDTAPLVATPRTSTPDATPGEIAIAARGLTRRFGSFIAVDRVDFSIERGTIYGFLGSNGCGKTTTMKMLTGLLPASEGEAFLFGQPVDAHNLALRHRIGYMSQSFSLYEELSVQQNLVLHARLFHLPHAQAAERIAALAGQFELESVLTERAGALPLGLRQRLSLAIAVLHEPDILILDEPTSGVDPRARELFWRHLLQLSREKGVTLFVSTHFMNEAERCDRIALMHAGRVLAEDTPAGLIRAAGQDTLEEAFIHYLRKAQDEGQNALEPLADSPAESHPRPPETSPATQQAAVIARPSLFSAARLWAYAAREAREVIRDPIRLAFAWLGTLILMIVMGLGISLDVENLRYAVLDYDRTPASRDYLQDFAGSRYFSQAPPLASETDAYRALQGGAVSLVVEIPPGFGRALQRGDTPEVAFWLDGAVPFRTENIRGYALGVHERYLAGRFPALDKTTTDIDARLNVRLRYNPNFLSIYAIAPGVIAVLMLVIPATLTALAVVREKEMGSITNLYASPATRLEFLLGKQLPYVALGFGNFLMLLAVVVWGFAVPIQGSLAALLGAGLVYVLAATAWGLLISTFTHSQIAAIFAAFILTMLPAIQFSGLIKPVSSLEGPAAVLGQAFPASHFLQISVGLFTKAVPPLQLLPQGLLLFGFFLLFLLASLALLRPQER